jgi:hypothetical protein
VSVAVLPPQRPGDAPVAGPGGPGAARGGREAARGAPRAHVDREVSE